MDYRGDIEYIDEKGKRVTVTWSGLQSSTSDALHAMHRYAQCEHKPHLRFDAYTVKRLEVHYKDEDRTRDRRERIERIEIPKGLNPDVRRHKIKPEPHPDFPFVNADLLSQSQKAREASSA